MQRRHFLQIMGASAVGTLASRIAFSAPAVGARAKSVILLWMNGGPSHIDTWDPKTGPTGGAFQPMKTKQKDLEICGHLPQVAEIADKLAVMRGLSAKEGNHQRAQYLMHTGYAPNPTVVHPAMGAWLSAKLGATPSGLPAFVSLGGPSAGPGFLGVQNGPFVIPRAGGMPDNVAPTTDHERFENRLRLLEGMEEDFAKRSGSALVEQRRDLYKETVRLMGASALKSFDIDSEPDAVKKAYGDTAFGKGCLVARRLVESGVRFVEVWLDGWDTHQNNFERVRNLLGQVDPAMSTLIKDLETRKLLDSTLVAWMGDFGRTPKINGNDGRDHFPQAQSAVFAGAKIKPGIYGGTSPAGDKVVGTPYSVPDVMATIASLAGLSPNAETMTPVGRPIAVTDNGTPIAPLIG
jgi:uncharacterized protein (DUF1501 family)